jgi:hypothetical protein
MSKFFMQYTCDISDEIQEDKFNKISLAAANITFIAFCFGSLIYYLKEMSYLD